MQALHELGIEPNFRADACKADSKSNIGGKASRVGVVIGVKRVKANLGSLLCLAFILQNGAF